MQPHPARVAGRMNPGWTELRHSYPWALMGVSAHSHARLSAAECISFDPMQKANTRLFCKIIQKQNLPIVLPSCMFCKRLGHF